MDRNAVVAGHFYPKDKASLIENLEKLILSKAEKKTAKGIVLPHAGFQYSGAVAGETIGSVVVPEVVIILGPSHTGQGHPYSIISSGIWKTPLGEINISEELAKKLLLENSLLVEDESAHAYEHCVEVLLPFIQFINNQTKIVPIVISDFKNENFKEIGKSIAAVISKFNQDVLLIASTDFTHYEPQDQACKKDAEVIDAILKLDSNKMLKIVREQKISMCGYAPVAVMVNACSELKAQKGDLIKYQTSGDASGDYDSVVGYGGIVIN